MYIVKISQFELDFEYLNLKSAQFDQESLTFEEVLTGIWRNSLKVPIEPLKIVFLALPSVKHLKKYEKGGFLEICINL